MSRLTACGLSAVCGLAAPAVAQERVDQWPWHTGVAPTHVGTIVIDAATGERTMTPGQRDGGFGADPLWLNNFTFPGCGGDLLIVDDPDLDGDGFGDQAGGTGATFPLEGMWLNWWGDIDANSVVQRVIFTYATLAPDTDADGNSIGDGIAGFDMTVSFADGDDGFDAADRRCVTRFDFENMPGAVPSLPPGSPAVYTVSIELKANAPSMIFELGDTDGYDQTGTGNSGGAIHGVPTGQDLDGDGRMDFSYGIRFDQSQAVSRGATYVRTVARRFSPEFPEAFGVEDDAFDFYETGPSCPPDSGSMYLGSFISGITPCLIPSARPRAFGMELYGFVAPCAADLAEPIGTLDFSDVVAFLGAFGSMEASADLALPTGVFDFSDVVAFLGAFGSGCGF